MKEYFAIAEVHYYNSVDNTTESENIVLTEVENFSDTMGRIEKYYGSDLEDVKITLFEGPFVALTDYSVDRLMKGEEI